MNRKSIRGSLLLLLTSLIWGVAFVAQSAGMDYVGPWTFNASRFLIGGIVLLPFAIRKRDAFLQNRTVTIKGGISCGLALAAASLFQQFGILHTSVGKAGFITALYIIIVPILGIFLGKKLPLRCGIAALLAAYGFYLLCLTEGLVLQIGDGLVLVCAFLFSIQILTVDYYSTRASGVLLACIQFFTCAALCSVGMVIFERPAFQDILSGWLPILYAGALSCGVAYTLQIIAQKDVEPTLASLIMSLESVISALAGWVLLGQSLSGREILGCVIVFLAIILAQLPNKLWQKKEFGV